MKVIIACLSVLCIYFFACSEPSSVEGRLKKFMKDTVVQKFDDPASYQFVSLRIDTFRGGDYIRNLKQIYNDTILLSPETRVRDHQIVDSLSTLSGYDQSILSYQTHLSFRGKNKMGALILDSIRLFYYPDVDKVEVKPN